LHTAMKKNNISTKMSKTEMPGTLKAIILGAGRSGTGSMQDGDIPACLLGDNFGSRVLDWILAAFAKVNINNIVFVGGFRITEIAEKYRRLKYIYNSDWKNTGVIESLNKAKSELDSPLFMSYADIVFAPITCKRILDEGLDYITIAVDTSWRDRGNLQENEIRKNMVVLDDGYVQDIGFLPVSNKLDAEFIGLAFFGPKSLPLLNSFFNDQFPRYIGKVFEQSGDVRNAFLTDLFRYFIKKGVMIKAVDIGSEWAEMDSPRDLCRFVIGTKAQTLDRLSSVIKLGKFCKQYIFTTAEWRDNRDKIMNEIRDLFYPEIIVVRSSTPLEDSWQSSCAGRFRSVTGVDSTDPKETNIAISEVIESYTRNGLDHNQHNQVLVQEMVRNVVISGVVLTRDLETGAPYYVINYDDESFKTDTVTSGSSNNLKVLLVNRASVSRVQNARISSLLKVVQEIEVAAGSTYLDIEFAISADECVYILQTRPLTCIPGDDIPSSVEENELERIRDFLRHKFARVPFLYGDSTIFGDMPDWNPVEMIGSRPRPLATSLYHYLITNSAWRIARDRLGYFNPEPATLMSCIGGHPYIDVRCSFNNYLPASLSPGLSEKLVNYYLRRLRAHPELHDKIEFDVMITCLDFSFENESKRLQEDGFYEHEIREFREGLFALTDGIISGCIEPIHKLVQEIETLNRKKYDILNACHDTSQIPTLVGHLLDNCVKLGTIPFAILARYGFIANSFLKSLVDRGVFTPKDRQAFMHSIGTVAAELVAEMNSVIAGRLSRDDFLKKYGHLRPGTYNITSYRYDEKPDLYFPLQSDGIKFAVKESADLERFEMDILRRKKIERLIAETGFTFTVDQLLLFMHDAIKYREYGKFEFTKTVSDILVLLEKFGKEYKYSRDSLSYLNIEQVRLWGINAYPFDYGTLLEAEIENGKRLFERSHTIRLPHLITCAEDIEIINIAASKPNFVTLKKVTGRVQYINGNIDPSSVKGKIVLIEAADPGFDWIFANGIIGLVTKYGGAASHMTIRAAEFGIPAAIGCGEYLFEKLRPAFTITLDSGSQAIYVT
jgi:glutamine kinase